MIKREAVNFHKKKTTLALKALPLMIRIAVWIILFTSVGMLIISYFERIEDYKKSGLSYARMASEYIDGDTVSRYLETGETDEYYDKVQDFLNIVGRDGGLEYYSVFVPYEDHGLYVWDAQYDDMERKLGYSEGYVKDGKEYVFKVFSKDPADEILIRKDEDNEYLAIACYPIFDSRGEPVALADVCMDMESLLETVFKYFLLLVIIVITVLLLSMIVLYRNIESDVIDPILKVNSAAREMIENLDSEESISIEINTGDELEELAGSFNHMNREIRGYLNNLVSVTAERERIGTELNVATCIQADMLPCSFPAFPDRDDFDIFASMTPAKEVGGDFYDFFLLDDDHLAMVMADVSEKGIPAALFMVISKTLIKDQAQMCRSPKTILEEVNNKLYESNGEGMFVTVWLGILTISTGHIVAANAGHEYPALRKADGKFELVIDKHGFVLGTMKDMKYTEYEMELEKGGCLFLYTDGVPEATNADEQLFGTDRMIEALNKEPGAAPEALLTNVKKATDEFVGEAPQFDDLTMMAVTLK